MQSHCGRRSDLSNTNYYSIVVVYTVLLMTGVLINGLFINDFLMRDVFMSDISVDCVLLVGSPLKQSRFPLITSNTKLTDLTITSFLFFSLLNLFKLLKNFMEYATKFSY